VGNADGVGTNATFNFKIGGGAAFDATASALYFFDSTVGTSVSRLRKLNMTSLQVTTITPTIAFVNTSGHLAWDKTTGTMIYSGQTGTGFYRITTSGTVTQLYTSSGSFNPTGFVIDASGSNIYYLDQPANGFFKLNVSTGVSTKIGGGASAGTDGLGAAAGFTNGDMGLGPGGTIYMTESTNFRKIVIVFGSGGIIPYNTSLYTSDASTALTVQAPLTCAKTISIQQIQETLNTITSPGSGTVAADWSTGDIWYVSSMSANFTINITNLPTTANKSYSVVFTLVQGATPYYISALQIAGVAQTIKWVGASTPTATASRVETETFTLMYTGSAWTVLGQLTSFG
jgi:hypothetical protein